MDMLYLFLRLNFLIALILFNVNFIYVYVTCLSVLITCIK
jgi:hypothetical protein